MHGNGMQKLMADFDRATTFDGLPPHIKSGPNRFSLTVHLVLENEPRTIFNAYAVVWHRWLMIFTEHSNEVFDKKELSDWWMENPDRIEVPNVSLTVGRGCRLALINETEKKKHEKRKIRRRHAHSHSYRMDFDGSFA